MSEPVAVMELRDYFATHIAPNPSVLVNGVSKAVATHIVGRAPPEDRDNVEYWLFTVEMSVAFRYQIADAMLLQRAK